MEHPIVTWLRCKDYILNSINSEESKKTMQNIIFGYLNDPNTPIWTNYQCIKFRDFIGQENYNESGFIAFHDYRSNITI
jgi:hypothetical protein